MSINQKQNFLQKQFIFTQKHFIIDISTSSIQHLAGVSPFTGFCPW